MKIHVIDRDSRIEIMQWLFIWLSTKEHVYFYSKLNIINALFFQKTSPRNWQTWWPLDYTFWKLKTKLKNMCQTMWNLNQILMLLAMLAQRSPIENIWINKHKMILMWGSHKRIRVFLKPVMYGFPFKGNLLDKY